MTDEQFVERMIARCVVDSADMIRKMLGIGESRPVITYKAPVVVIPRNVRTTSKRLARA